MLTWIDEDAPLPPARQALGADSDAPGLVAAGGRVTPQRLEEAYRRGIFPWFGPGQPVLWWSPDPRMVLPVAEFRLSHSLRKTLRKSMSTGGVPIDVMLRKPRPARPELVVLCDVSGSVAGFSHFTLLLVHALRQQFSRVRVFAFIDTTDEVTHLFEGVDDIAEAVHRVNTEADVVWVDGHSDYGHAFEVFWETYGKDVNSKSTVLILGDARNNYHAAQSWILKEIEKKARKLFWLNPEPKAYWNTGDSIVGEYGAHCDGVFEVRNLRQLEKFVDNLA